MLQSEWLPGVDQYVQNAKGDPEFQYFSIHFSPPVRWELLDYIQ